MDNRNEPASPVVQTNDYVDAYYGLTKREHFAGLAMQGLLSNAGLNGEILETANDRGNDISDVITLGAIELADALLAALEKS